MTTTTTETTPPLAADARLIPLDAILAFEAESAALGDVLDAAANVEDLLASAACIDCHLESDQVSLLLDPSVTRADFLPTEALLVDTATINPECSCPRGDQPCSASCSVPECQVAYSAHNGG